jgi:hypothetical protein
MVDTNRYDVYNCLKTSINHILCTLSELLEQSTAVVVV